MATNVDDERECRMCLDSDIIKPGDGWLSPCNCSGSMKWVHRSCLEQWINHAVHPNQVDYCNTCGFQYKKRLRLKRLSEFLIFPSRSGLVNLLRSFFHLLPSVLLALVDVLMGVFLVLLFKLCLMEGFARVLDELLMNFLDEPQMVCNMMVWVLSFHYRPRRQLYRQLAEWTLFKPDFDSA